MALFGMPASQSQRAKSPQFQGLCRLDERPGECLELPEWWRGGNQEKLFSSAAEDVTGPIVCSYNASIDPPGFREAAWVFEPIHFELEQSAFRAQARALRVRPPQECDGTTHLRSDAGKTQTSLLMRQPHHP
jgi:hypothetical protein